MAGERNDCRISLRFTKAEIELIDHAARVLGQYRSAFLREAAVKAAEKVLSGEHHAKPAANPLDPQKLPEGIMRA